MPRRWRFYRRSCALFRAGAGRPDRYRVSAGLHQYRTGCSRGPDADRVRGSRRRPNRRIDQLLRNRPGQHGTAIGYTSTPTRCRGLWSIRPASTYCSNMPLRVWRCPRRAAHARGQRTVARSDRQTWRAVRGLAAQHRRFGDGWRTTAQYAVTDDAWPGSEGGLLARIDQPLETCRGSDRKAMIPLRRAGCQGFGASGHGRR